MAYLPLTVCDYLNHPFYYVWAPLKPFHLISFLDFSKWVVSCSCGEKMLIEEPIDDINKTLIVCQYSDTLCVRIEIDKDPLYLNSNEYNLL